MKNFPQPNKVMPKTMKQAPARKASTNSPKGMESNFGTNGSSRPKKVK